MSAEPVLQTCLYIDCIYDNDLSRFAEVLIVRFYFYLFIQVINCIGNSSDGHSLFSQLLYILQQIFIHMK